MTCPLGGPVDSSNKLEMSSILRKLTAEAEIRTLRTRVFLVRAVTYVP